MSGTVAPVDTMATVQMVAAGTGMPVEQTMMLMQLNELQQIKEAVNSLADGLGDLTELLQQHVESGKRYDQQRAELLALIEPIKEYIAGLVGPVDGVVPWPPAEPVEAVTPDESDAVNPC